VAVPDVLGLVEADALVDIGAAGLTAGERTRAYSSKVRSGRVISTDPRAGVMVRRGTAIDYVISRGPRPTPSPTARPTPRPTPRPTSRPTPRPTPSPTPRPTDTPANLLDGSRWSLTNYRDADGNTIELPSDVTLPTATFQDGSLSGTTGCNPYATSYQIGGVQRLTLGPISSGGKACAEPDATLERLFLDALGSTDRFTLSEDGHTLRLRGPSGTPVLYFGPARR
jgi:heat shock protein HslJ